MTRAIAKLLDAKPNRVRMDQAGLNHMVFGLRTYLDGKDVSGEVIERMARYGDVVSMNNIAPIDWSPDFIRSLGVVPCPYLRYYVKREEMLSELLEEFEHGKTRAEVVKAMEAELFKQYADPTLNVKPKQLEKRGGAYYSDAACDLIDAIYNDRRDIQTVNTRNRGALPELPYDSAVEVSCLVTSEGPVPINVGELPVQVKGLVQQIKTFERLAAQAAVQRDYNAGLLALTMNPLSGSDLESKKVFDEMLEAHRQFLPGLAGHRG
jgi:6-phospho-beta-glucosidase